MTQEKAYMLGFLAADGWISRNSLGFALKRSDRAAVERFAHLISSEINKPIGVIDYESKCSNGKYYPASKFVITDSLLVDRLSEFGIIPRKSYIDINYFDYIPDEYKMAWVLGLFDGDGGITIITDDKHKNNAIIHFTGRLDFLTKLRDYLGCNGHIRKTKTEASVLTIASKEAVIDFLSKYIDFSSKVQVLERKLVKAKETLEIMLRNDRYCSGIEKLHTSTCEVCGKSFKSVGDKKCRECLIEEYKNKPAMTNNQEVPCSICGKPTKGKSKQGICVECAHKQQARTDLTPETLQELMKTMNFTQLGKKYGVSANAIKKRAVNWGIYESKGSSTSVDEVKIMKVFLKELNVKNTAKICEVSEWSVSNKLSKFDSRYKRLLLKGDIIKDDLGHYYESLEIAANALGDSSYTRHIQENLKGLRLTAYGRVFTYGTWQEYIEYLLDASNNSERAIVYRDIYNSIYSENIKESLSDMS